MEANLWRYIPPLVASGSVQMAIDTWLLEQHHRHGHSPALRFYRWSSPTISLGYHQRRYPDFWNDLPIDIVRRPTGGRAVLHDGDLTYSVVTSGLSGSISQIYGHICQFLIEGWRSLGVELHYGEAGRGYIHSANCFGTATAADLVDSGGNKFIGSAQLKRGNFILQHGSILIGGDRSLFEKVFGTPAPASVGAGGSIETAIETLKTSAANCFACQLVPRPLSGAEWREIDALAGKLASQERLTREFT